MTCVVGYCKDGKVYLGGDSAGVEDTDIVVRKDSKVFKNKKFAMGICGSFRMGDILRYRFVPPSVPKGMCIEKYMATDFIDACRDCFAKHAFGKMESGEQEGGNFLVGY